MNVESVRLEKPLLKTIATTVAIQLLFSLSPVVAFADTDSAISNNSVPLPAANSSGLVKRIWGSINPRKLKQADLATPNPEKTEATPSPLVEQATNTPVPQAETASISSSAPTPVPAPEAPLLERLAPEAVSQDKTAVETAPQAVVENSVLQSPSAPATDAVVFSSNSASSDSSSEKTGSQFTTVASNILALPPGAMLSRMPTLAEGDGPVVVDNDEAVEVQETLKYEELETDEGKTKAKVGARFPVVISSEITTKTAKKGDPIQGRLKYDLKIADRHIAKKGSVVNGHLNYSLKARTIMHSLVSPERWYRNSGCVGFSFDEIINEKGEHLPLKAQPARAARIVKNKGEGRELGVNHYGQITGPWSQQLRYKAIRLGLNAALGPAGVFSFGAMPIALGVIGAANPSFAFAKPVGLNVRHRRIKGFAWGFLSGIPGSFLIEDTTVKGQEAVIKPGDEFYAEFVEEFTGEPATDAQLMPGASTKVRGQIMTETKKSKKKKD